MNVKDLNTKTHEIDVNDDPDDPERILTEIGAKWEAALADSSNLLDILLRLDVFLREASKSSCQELCRRYGFSEIWTILTENEDDNIKDLCLRILSQVIPYKNEALGMMQSEECINFIFELLMSLNEEICEDSLELLCVLINENQEITEHLLELGIIDQMKLLTTNAAYGTMVLFLAKTEGEHIPSLIELLSFCMHSSSINVKTTFTTLGCILSYAEENSDSGLTQLVLEFIAANAKIISKQKDGSIIKEIMYVFGMFDELELPFAEIILALMKNSIQYDKDDKEKGIFYGCSLFLQFADAWGGNVEEALFPTIIEPFERASYKSKQVIAKVLLKYFPYAKQMSAEVANIFGYMMSDSEIGKDCIVAFSVMLQNFSKDPDMSELILKYVDKVFEAASSDNDEILEAAELFINIFREIQGL